MGNKVFSTRIKELREKKELSMDQLAKQLNVTKSRVNMWENNGTVPRMDVEMNKAIEAGMSDPAPTAQAAWKASPFNGSKPSPEEFILWCASQIDSQ